MPQVILWGMDVMDDPFSRSRSWRMLVGVVAMTVVVMCSCVYWIEMGVPVPGGESTIVLVTK